MPIARSATRFVRWSITLAAAGLAVVMLSARYVHRPGRGKSTAGERHRVRAGPRRPGHVDRQCRHRVHCARRDYRDEPDQRTPAVINAVVGAGVDRNNISTTGVSRQPQYSDVGTTRTITGYRVDNSIAVKIHPPDAASHVLGVIVATGGDATRINWVSYSIEDDSQLVKDARARAFQDAKNRAEQYAQLSGLTLGKVISISEASGAEAAKAPPAGLPARCRWNPASRR
jgi:uncharacterized protein